MASSDEAAVAYADCFRSLDGSSASTQELDRPPSTGLQARSHSVSSTCSEPAAFKPHLPRFTALAPDASSLPAPSARVPGSPIDFAFPSLTNKRISRPNSPSNPNRIFAPRSRVANIRRESDCSLENEVAHERYIKTAAQVSSGFEEFSLDPVKSGEERKRAKSITDQLSINVLTNTFVASAQSPTRAVDVVRQCYSPSTQQLVRSNISYSPSPSPTPSSPKQSRIMRSMSPIVTRQIQKRRLTNGGSAVDSDNEGPPLSSKRQCTSFSTGPSSPFVTRASSPAVSECSTTSSLSFRQPPSATGAGPGSTGPQPQADLSDESVTNDDAASTAFSSRAGTPIDDLLLDTPTTTTATGLVRTVALASSPSPFASGRMPLPPSPLAANQKIREGDDI